MAKIAETDLIAVRSYISRSHREIDAALRAGDRAALAELDAHIRLATFGLFQLPAYRGPVFRSALVDERAVARYQPGAVIVEPAFVSASADARRRFPGNLHYVIQSVNGRLVRALADDPEELEVVFFTRTRFEVLAVDAAAAAGERIVYLAEIPDPRLAPRAA